MDNIELLKEASDVISGLVEKIKILETRIEDINKREKLANELEEKNLLPFSKIHEIRAGTISEEELKKYELLKDFDITDSNFDFTKKSSIHQEEEYDEALLDTPEGRRQYRGMVFVNQLSNYKK